MSDMLAIISEKKDLFACEGAGRRMEKGICVQVLQQQVVPTH
jgi:hypothetical protein